MSVKSKVFKIVLPVVILIAGVMVMMTLVKSKKPPQREARVSQGVLVTTMQVKASDYKVRVEGSAMVEPAKRVSLVPQVSGKVTWISPSLVDGGFFQEGQPMLVVDQADYVVALEQAKAARAMAEVDLETTKSRARIAKKEWELINKGQAAEDEPNPLVLYEPQLKSAEASLASAQSAVRQAELDLERTKIFAPFNCRVVTENVEIGKYVTKGGELAQLMGTDEVEIRVPLQYEELKWFGLPDRKTGRGGARAEVLLTLGSEVHRWNGRVLRSIGELDAASRTIEVVVGVNDPYGLISGKRGAPSLVYGAFVDVVIEGRTVKDVIIIPVSALRDGSTVWTMDSENLLQIKKVEVLRAGRGEVVISSGLEGGEVIVLTNVTGAADGMKLKPVKEGSK